MPIFRPLGFVVAFMLSASAAGAQTPTTTPSPQPTPSPSSDASVRPATPTFHGDTGLWYVPTAEVLAHGAWSAGGYRAGNNYLQGFTNVADFAGTFGVGIKGRVELFGAFRFDTRIDRDLRPLFSSSSNVGGAAYRYPFVNTYWSGDNVGDLYVGAKFNITSELRQSPAAFALRAMVKAPTADKDKGIGTGKADFLVDAIVSKELNQKVELTGFGGFIARGSPDGATLPNALRWGVGAGFPSRGPIRITAELHGEAPSTSSMTLTTPIVGIDGSRSPLTFDAPKFWTATLGATWQARNGFFVGSGLNLNMPGENRTGLSADTDVTGDFIDFQVAKKCGASTGERRSSSRCNRLSRGL
jgi:hypothetical protein